MQQNFTSQYPTRDRKGVDHKTNVFSTLVINIMNLFSQLRDRLLTRGSDKITSCKSKLNNE